MLGRKRLPPFILSSVFLTLLGLWGCGEAESFDCTHECDYLGGTSCLNGTYSICNADEKGCRSWESRQCGDSKHPEEGPACTLKGSCCVHACDADDLDTKLCHEAETFGDAPQIYLVPCIVDENGCNVWDVKNQDEICKSGFCKDDHTCGVCDDECPEYESSQCKEGKVRICLQDKNGCLFWGEYKECPTHECDDGNLHCRN